MTRLLKLGGNALPNDRLCTAKKIFLSNSSLSDVEGEMMQYITVQVLFLKLHNSVTRILSGTSISSV